MLLGMSSKVLRVGFVIALVVLTISMDAQCPMCKMAAESNLENGGTEGKGLNTGILYMLLLPYLLVSAIGYLWWRNNRKARDLDDSEPDNSEFFPSHS